MPRSAYYSNFLVVAILIGAAATNSLDKERFISWSQEDSLLEWATFWSFLLAALVYGRATVIARNRGVMVPWFHAGLALFCVFVALEEISWGQRLAGYTPPEYFLAENYQQEFNLHNLVKTSFRSFALLAVLWGYGVVVSIAGVVPFSRQLMDRWHIVAPPPWLVPVFALAAIFYQVYPWRFTGEWVELLMGLGFLFASLSLVNRPGGDLRPAIGASAMMVVLAIATLGLQAVVKPSDETRIRIARTELQALADDFLTGTARTRCNIHRRLYTFMVRNDQPGLASGRFARLVRESGDPVRAEYLLDPWNSPYWLRHFCRGGRTDALVYSFGPNRQRDSTALEVVQDDLAAWIIRSD